MIIFGFRSFVVTLFSGRLQCPRCGPLAMTHVRQRRRYFTLFFIPVLPLGKEQWWEFTCCGVGLMLTKEQLKEMTSPVVPALSERENA